MIHDVIDAKYCNNYRLEILFDDGKKGIVDLSRYAEKGGVFKKFKDLIFFRDFVVSKELGTITWANEIDIAPEVLYSDATNTPLPAWMQ
ncbi:MAG: DUF2442 domain-containing protein [Victivallales bacterium]|nr:DUF2442 domain-containing protein [Victivallales bacterium]